jgi:hypothetical protein
LLFFSFFLPACFATTVIVLVTPNGIVVGADSKVTRLDVGDMKLPEPSEMRKVFGIKNRFVVATSYLGKVDLLEPRSGKYIFRYVPEELLAGIEKSLGEQSSIGELIDTVGTVNSSALNPYPFVLNLPIEKQFHPLSVWIVVGYEHTVPIVDAVSFDINWKENRIEAPVVIPWHPDLEFGLYRGLYAIGYTSAVMEAEAARYGTKNTEGYRYCVIHALPEFNKFLSGIPLTPDEAVALVHTLLMAQTKQTSTWVGPPFLIAFLSRNGGITESVYAD